MTMTPNERSGFGKGETVLHDLADTKSARVQKSEKRDQENCDQLFARKTDRIARQNR